MHLALIIDGERLRRERAMLQQIATDLAARDIQLTAIVPDPSGRNGTGDDEPMLDGPTELQVRMHVPPWMRRSRARQIAGTLANATPDLIHAIGEQAWTVGLDLARVIDRPVTLDVWSADLLKRVPPGRAAARVAAYIAATEPLADALRDRVEPGLVSVVPMGVRMPPQPRKILADPEASMCLAIIGSGRDLPGYRALLTGLSRLTSDLPQIQAFLELRGPCEHEIWRQARRLDLLGHVSTIVDAALHRPLLTGCDVLVVPERLGHIRTIVLEAMAVGMPVVAADDPYVDVLVHDQTALIVDHDSPEDWAEKLKMILTDPELSSRLIGTARELIGRRHHPAAQSDSLADAFQQVLSGGAHAFDASV